MPINRLAELKKGGEDGENGSNGTSGGGGKHEHNPEIAEHMKFYDDIKKRMELIETNTEQIQRLRAKQKTTANAKARQDIQAQRDEIMASTDRERLAIKKALDKLKTENEAYEKENDDNAIAQMRNNLLQTHTRRFKKLMTDYMAATSAFKDDLKNQQKREVKIVDSSLTDEEVNQLVETGRSSDVIKQALLSDSLQDVVRGIEERHLDILKLERQVVEIFELFRDLATLVDLQQESLDVIEERIMNAKSYTERAEVELQEAEDYQRKARNRRCCLFIIVLCIFAVIFLPLLGFTQSLGTSF